MLPAAADVLFVEVMRWRRWRSYRGGGSCVTWPWRRWWCWELLQVRVQQLLHTTLVHLIKADSVGHFDDVTSCFGQIIIHVETLEAVNTLRGNFPPYSIHGGTGDFPPRLFNITKNIPCGKGLPEFLYNHLIIISWFHQVHKCYWEITRLECINHSLVHGFN